LLKNHHAAQSVIAQGGRRPLGKNLANYPRRPPIPKRVNFKGDFWIDFRVDFLA
jgi:hypothetical protein